MKKIVKNAMYASAGAGLLALNSVSAAIDPGTVSNRALVEDSTADVVIQWYIANALTFLYLVAVVFALWGGFNILTAAWDEEKVKKWKTIIIQALIWIVVIFLAGTIVEWLITAIL